MNLEESNLFVEEERKNSRRKKSVLVSIGICAVLVVLLLILISWIKSEDEKTLKMYLNGNQISITSTIFTDVNGETYVNVKEIGEMFGYTYTKGEYGKYNEDETCCYLTNDYEIIAVNSGEDTFKKYSEYTGVDSTIAELVVTVKSEDGTSKQFSMSGETTYVNEAIYVPFESIVDMFGANLDLSTTNRIRIYSFESVVASAQSTITSLGYTTISGDYENLQAMTYGLAVVGDGTYLGVVSLTTGKQVISLKYDDITFIPNTNDFLVKASNTVGILAADGSNVIKPADYDEISVYDDENQLYLVKKDSKYGILNRNGTVIIYPDYTEIGYTTQKDFEFVEGTGNSNIFFGKAIPVKDGTKYGLYNIDGEEILASAYSGFYSSSESGSSTAGEKAVITIPETVGIKGVVIEQDDMFGIFDVETEKIIIPCVCSKVYSITKTAITTYYFDYNGQTVELSQYLIDNDLVSVKSTEEDDDDEDLENENVIANETVETSSDTDTSENVVEDSEVVDVSDETEVVETTEEE